MYEMIGFQSCGRERSGSVVEINSFSLAIASNRCTVEVATPRGFGPGG